MGYQPQYPNYPNSNDPQPQGGYPQNTQYPPYQDPAYPSDPYQGQQQQHYPNAAPYPPPQQPYPPIYPAPMPYPNTPGYAQPTQSNGYAIAGLIVGIISFLVLAIPILNLAASITGIILSQRGNKPFLPQKGMAVAGLVISIITLIIAVIYSGLFIIGLIASANHP